MQTHKSQAEAAEGAAVQAEGQAVERVAAHLGEAPAEVGAARRVAPVEVRAAHLVAPAEARAVHLEEQLAVARAP